MVKAEILCSLWLRRKMWLDFLSHEPRALSRTFPTYLSRSAGKPASQLREPRAPNIPVHATPKAGTETGPHDFDAAVSEPNAPVPAHQGHSDLERVAEIPEVPFGIEIDDAECAQLKEAYSCNELKRCCKDRLSCNWLASAVYAAEQGHGNGEEGSPLQAPLLRARQHVANNNIAQCFLRAEEFGNVDAEMVRAIEEQRAADDASRLLSERAEDGSEWKISAHAIVRGPQNLGFAHRRVAGATYEREENRPRRLAGRSYARPWEANSGGKLPADALGDRGGVVSQEAIDSLFCPSQEKFHTFFLRGVRNISEAP